MGLHTKVALLGTAVRAAAVLLTLFAGRPAECQTPDSAASAAAAAIQNKHFAEAVSQLQIALTHHPSDPNLWNLLGIADTELSHGSAAEHAFRRGLQIAPGSMSLNENAGLFYFRQAKYAQAKTLLANAVKLGSSQPGVRFSLAAARLRTGEPDIALRDLRSLESDLADVPDYWLERGRVELMTDPEASGVSFDHALALSPRNLAALNGAAEAAERQGIDEKALAYLIQARSTAPDDIPTLMHFASICIRRDLGPDAVAALDKARTLQPGNENVIYLLARANISVQQWQRAHELFAEFLRKRPRFAPAYYALGWLDIRLNRTSEAKSELQHALTLDPELNDARCDLAQLDLDDGETENAGRLLETVLHADPHHVRANVALADIKMRDGNLSEAQRLLETAIAQNPNVTAAHYKLATVYTRLHRLELAETQRKLAADLAAEDKRASKTQLRLVLPESTGATKRP